MLASVGIEWERDIRELSTNTTLGVNRLAGAGLARNNVDCDRAALPL